MLFCGTLFTISHQILSSILLSKMANCQPSSKVHESRSSPSNNMQTEVAASEPCDACIQFFLRMNNGGETLVMRSHESDTVMSIQLRVHQLKGIPVVKQKLVYHGKELDSLSTLGSCGIENDSTVHLTLRIFSKMPSQPIAKVLNCISMLCKGDVSQSVECFQFIKKQFQMFLKGISLVDAVTAKRNLDEFLMSSGPSSLVLLHNSASQGNRKTAYYCVKALLEKFKQVSGNDELCETCFTILLQLCKSLRGTALEDGLYVDCLVGMKLLLQKVECANSPFGRQVIKKRRLMNGGDSPKIYEAVLREITPYAVHWTVKLTEDLKRSVDSPDSQSPLDDEIQNFESFFYCWHKAIIKQARSMIPISLPLDEELSSSLPLYGEEIELLNVVYSHLLDEMDKYLGKIEGLLDTEESEDVVAAAGRCHYLTVLRELYRSTYIIQDAKDKFWEVMRRRDDALCALIEGSVRPNDEIYNWLLEHKYTIGFKVRRELYLVMFPHIEPDEGPNELVIDRSQLLRESFSYVHGANADFFWSELYIKFRNEDASGPGVLREWFCLVCKDLFNHRNALFLSCPNDLRRFYPNPGSSANPQHLDYFVFSGRMIALALMYNVQVGVLFDRSFFLQITGRSVTLEDIRDTDPIFYRSCKHIIEMEAEMLDSGALGLTFVSEAEESGSRTVVELSPGGENIEVNSKNRKVYVDLLITHRFVTSIADQVAHFSQGFADVLIDPRLLKYFFLNIELEDLDWMLGGSEVGISVTDWQAYTDCNGYQETDPHIQWFWKIVEEMSPEKKRLLLFYWTSVTYLPVEGFSGLGNRLSINKVDGSLDHLPTSHTCFYQLCFPPYHSIDIMRDRLYIITQEHFSNSFGNV